MGDTNPATRPDLAPGDTDQFSETMVGLSLPGMCGQGDLEGVKAALRRGEEVNLRGGKYNKTGLIWAADEGHESIVELLLLQPGLDVNLTDGDGDTALHDACAEGHEAIVKRLLAHPSLRQTCKMSFSLLNPNFRLKKLTSKSA